MAQIFNSKFFINNRKNLVGVLGTDNLIILTANGMLQKNADEPHAFKQDGNFWYLTGITISDCVLVIYEGQEFIILPKRSEYLNIFDGKFDTTIISKQSGIDEILDYESGWERLNNIVKKQKEIMTLAPPPEFIIDYGFYTNPAKNNLLTKLRQINEDFIVNDIGMVLRQFRMVKQAEEVKAITKAIEITGKAIDKVRKNIKTFKNEYEIEALLSFEFRMNGARGHSFNPIISSGKNATILHYNLNNKKLVKGELIQIDIGAEYEFYAADISRVFSASNPSSRQIKVYQAVLDVQKFAMNLVKPGLNKQELEFQTQAYMGNKLIDLGLIKSNIPDEVRKYFPHAVSHHMGYDVHDYSDYNKPLDAGMVITIEPGIYIPEEEIGIRIEDDILVTNDGFVNLSENINKSLI